VFGFGFGFGFGCKRPTARAAQMNGQIRILEGQRKKLREFMDATPANDASLDGLRHSDWQLGRAIRDLKEFLAATTRPREDDDDASSSLPLPPIDLTGSSSESEDEPHGGAWIVDVESDDETHGGRIVLPGEEAAPGSLSEPITIVPRDFLTGSYISEVKTQSSSAAAAPPSMSSPSLDHPQEALPPSSKKTHSEIAQWEKHTKGFGLRMLQKMGYAKGDGLGKNGDGIAKPIEVSKRSQTQGRKTLDWLRESGTDFSISACQRKQKNEKLEGRSQVGLGLPSKKGKGSHTKMKREYENMSSAFALDLASSNIDDDLFEAVFDPGISSKVKDHVHAKAKKSKRDVYEDTKTRGKHVF
jgi:hypothetical protein